MYDPVVEELFDQSVAEECLPCHLMWLVATGLQLEGIVLRNDVWHKLSVGAATPLRHVRHDPPRVSKIARRVNNVCAKVLRQYAPASQEHGLYAVAMFCLKLVDEGMLADRQNMAVLVSLLLIEEMREAEGGNIRVKETVLKADANRLLDLIRREGLYPGSVQLTALDRIAPAGAA